MGGENHRPPAAMAGGRAAAEVATATRTDPVTTAGEVAVAAETDAMCGGGAPLEVSPLPLQSVEPSDDRPIPP